MGIAVQVIFNLVGCYAADTGSWGYVVGILDVIPDTENGGMAFTQVPEVTGVLLPVYGFAYEFYGCCCVGCEDDRVSGGVCVHVSACFCQYVKSCKNDFPFKDSIIDLLHIALNHFTARPDLKTLHVIQGTRPNLPTQIPT